MDKLRSNKLILLTRPLGVRACSVSAFVMSCEVCFSSPCLRACLCTVYTLCSAPDTGDHEPRYGCVGRTQKTLNLCMLCERVCVLCVCTGSRLVLLLPWGLRAHFLLCIVISFPVRSSQHHYISDKLHCKFSRPLAQRSIWDWFRMPCWAELEDQFEMDCSRQGANDTQCSAHLLSLLCFLHPSLSLTVISFSPRHYSLLSPPLSFNCFTLVLCGVVTLSYPACLSTFCINSY